MYLAAESRYDFRRTMRMRESDGENGDIFHYEIKVLKYFVMFSMLVKVYHT
jgi:hypothetical protein